MSISITLRTKIATRFAKKMRRAKRRLQRRGLWLVKKLRIYVISRWYRLAAFCRKWIQRSVEIAATFAATFISIVVAIVFSTFAGEAALKASESNLTAAQIIGGGLALILSLSIVPAQRAAELFSSSVIRIYSRDRPLLWVFLLLVFTTLLSVLLGSDWRFLSPRNAIALQFILLGVSFDGLRSFYLRLLDLLVPQTAIRLIADECANWFEQSQRDAARVVRYQHLAGIKAPVSLSQAVAFSASGLPNKLLDRTAQLEEFAHRFIARKETAAVEEIIATLAMIGKRYSEIRRTNALLYFDPQHPFAGAISEISQVLNPVYESILSIIEDAIHAKNERIAAICVRQLASLAQHSRTLPVEENGITSLPLAFSACFYFTRSIRAVLNAQMIDATRAGITGLQSVLLVGDSRTSSADSHALDELFYIAREGYKRADTLINFPAVSAILRTLQHQADIDGYSEGQNRSVMQHLVSFIPAEVSYDAAGLRKLETFPAYSLGFDASLFSLASAVAGRIKFDPDRPEANPFDDFLECSEDLRSHFRSLTEVKFQDSLLRVWVVKSLLAIVRLHLTLIVDPPSDTDEHVQPVVEAAGWLVSWVSGFFPEGSARDQYAEMEAINSLAVLGIDAVAEGEYEIALQVGSAIERIADNSAIPTPDAFRLADLQVPIETLARGADAMGAAGLAAELRTKIKRPGAISDNAWSYFEAARRNRVEQLESKLRKRPRRYGYRDDPAERLKGLIANRNREAQAHEAPHDPQTCG